MNRRAYSPGLEGVIAAETALSHVDGLRGELIISGYAVEDLAKNATYEEVAHLLWFGHLPTPGQLANLRHRIARHRHLPQETMRLLEAAARSNVAAMDALRMAAGTITLLNVKEPAAQALALLANIPPIVAAFANLKQGRSPVEPDPELGLAANYLYMLRGSKPSPAQVRALQTYLITVVDHGLNASTFTARTIVSTDSDLISAVVGAIGALKGPKHGGAPGPVLEMIQSIGRPENVEPALRSRLERGQRLMGFGHRVYKVRDPRAEILSGAATELYAADEGQNGLGSLYELARQVEATAVELLQEFKPGRNLQTNVEFYTALLLHGLGLDADFFSPTFAVGRLAGWIGHCLEQQRSGRMIRPQARYTGERDRPWIPLDRRRPQ